MSSLEELPPLMSLVSPQGQGRGESQPPSNFDKKASHEQKPTLLPIDQEKDKLTEITQAEQRNSVASSSTIVASAQATHQQSRTCKISFVTQEPPLPLVDKGKGKITKTSQPLIAQLTIDLAASSSLTVEPTQPKCQSQPRKKVYQPKYPSIKAQKCHIDKVIVPQLLLEEQWLRKGDTYKWVKRQTVEPRHSSGWIATQNYLDAQGYKDGN